MVLSGGGVQAGWRFDTPVELNGGQTTTRIETPNLSLALHFGGDGRARCFAHPEGAGHHQLPQREEAEARSRPVDQLLPDPVRQRGQRQDAMADRARNGANGGRTHAQRRTGKAAATEGRKAASRRTTWPNP